MWKTVCSLVWQLIPSMVCPVVAADVPASAGALGMGTFSGPSAPARGRRRQRPERGQRQVVGRVTDDSVAAVAPPPPLPPETATPTPTPTPATTTTAPAARPRRTRRLRRASARLASSIARRLFSREPDPDTGTPKIYYLRTYIVANRDYLPSRGVERGHWAAEAKVRRRVTGATFQTRWSCGVSQALMWFYAPPARGRPSARVTSARFAPYAPCAWPPGWPGRPARNMSIAQSTTLCAWWIAQSTCSGRRRSRRRMPQVGHNGRAAPHAASSP